MNIQIYRRRKLGHGSTLGISHYLKEMGINVDIIRKDRRKAYGDIIFRWGCTALVLNRRATVFNQAKNIQFVGDKVCFRRECIENDIKVPKTYFTKSDILADGIFPLLGRKRYHSQGKGAKVINNTQDIVYDNVSEYWSQIIRKEREFRVYCMNGRAIAVAKKEVDNTSALLWNRAQGSTFYNVRWGSWPLKVVAEAIKAHNLSGLDYSGVDVITKGNKVYVLEVNSAPSLTTEYRKQCFAKGFKWNIETRDRQLNIDTINSYKGMIHPAIC